MSEISANNKRIAKNTMLLYFRMGIIMLVQLYTSRVVLHTLGVEDYGIYNVVGGVMAMFGFINGAMSSATSRFITFALGKGDRKHQNDVFCASVNVHIIISLMIVLLAETVGLWYVETKLVLPPDRSVAAVWVYQCSILATLVMVMSVPFNATIIAHERMSAFAYISIIEVILKLLIVYLLVVTPYDKMLFYAILVFVIQLSVLCCYAIYCYRHFEETKYHFRLGGKLEREMGAFAVWSFWGNFAAVTYTQGLNLMLNFFFGPVVNAARAVAVQVQNAMTQFVTNFQMALNPQITKSYAQGKLDYMYNLMHRSARFSFYLLLMLAVPIQMETHRILAIWLVEVPEHTVVFLRIMLAVGLVYTLSNPLIILAQATGKVRKYQLVAGGVLLTIVPISYICLCMGLPAYSVFLVHFAIEGIDFFVRMYLLRGMCGLSVRRYILSVCVVVTRVAVIAYIPSILINLFLPDDTLGSIAVITLSLFFTISAIFLMGLTNNERQFATSKILYYIHKYM